MSFDLECVTQNKPINIFDVVFFYTMFNLFVIFLLQCFLSFGCNRLPYIKRLLTKESPTLYVKVIEKDIFIIRGVPGAGKKHLVYHMEKQFNDDKSFYICDRNDYFITDGEFKFNPKYIHQAEQQLRTKFIQALYETDINRVYVIGYFEELWMYEDFIRLGELNNCKVRVVELRCPDEDHLIYFNKRGKTSPPLIKSKKCFEAWEHRINEYIQEPYIEPLEGDCLPKYNAEAIEKNNKAFEDYLNGECAIESDDELDKTHEYPCEDNGDHIECLTEKDIKNVLEKHIVL